MRKKSARSRRKPRRTKKRPTIGIAQRPQDAVNPALLDSKEKEARADADASVEDPLQDWPEVEAEKDQWLLEREGEGDEPPER
jgi:hypothetical protein